MPRTESYDSVSKAAACIEDQVLMSMLDLLNGSTVWHLRARFSAIEEYAREALEAMHAMEDHAPISYKKGSSDRLAAHIADLQSTVSDFRSLGT